MGNKLFGIDIAAVVNSSIKSAGGVRPLVLTKTTPGTRTSADLTGGTNPTTTDYKGSGFVEDIGVQFGSGSTRQEGTIVQVKRRIVSILGDSLPAGIKPEPNDTVTLDGSPYTLGSLGTDPGVALRSCEVTE